MKIEEIQEIQEIQEKVLLSVQIAEAVISSLALGDLDEAIKAIQELKSKSEKTGSIKEAFRGALLVVNYNMRKAAIHGDVIEDITHYGREYIDPIHKFTEEVRRLVEK